jgi:hypothetical protein
MLFEECIDKGLAELSKLRPKQKENVRYNAIVKKRDNLVSKMGNLRYKDDKHAYANTLMHLCIEETEELGENSTRKFIRGMSAITSGANLFSIDPNKEDITKSTYTIGDETFDFDQKKSHYQSSKGIKGQEAIAGSSREALDDGTHGAEESKEDSSKVGRGKEVALSSQGRRTIPLLSESMQRSLNEYNPDSTNGKRRKRVIAAYLEALTKHLGNEELDVSVRTLEDNEEIAEKAINETLGFLSRQDTSIQKRQDLFHGANSLLAHCLLAVQYREKIVKNNVPEYIEYKTRLGGPWKQFVGKGLDKSVSALEQFEDGSSRIEEQKPHDDTPHQLKKGKGKELEIGIDPSLGVSVLPTDEKIEETTVDGLTDKFLAATGGEKDTLGHRLIEAAQKSGKVADEVRPRVHFLFQAEEEIDKEGIRLHARRLVEIGTPKIIALSTLALLNIADGEEKIEHADALKKLAETTDAVKPKWLSKATAVLQENKQVESASGYQSESLQTLSPQVRNEPSPLTETQPATSETSSLSRSYIPPHLREQGVEPGPLRPLTSLLGPTFPSDSADRRGPSRGGASQGRSWGGRGGRK